MDGRWSTGRLAAAIFLITSVIYGLVAWDRLPEASKQFHFVDLAHSMLAGRLDTDTPKQSHRRTNSEDPPGYREAIKRTTTGGGWNDWASLKTLTLEDGTVVRGRFPWPKAGGEQRHIFHTVDGEERKVVIPQDLSRTCGTNRRQPCNETHHYVSFPPFPAVVMMLPSLVWGYNTNDVLITVLFAGLNAALLFWLLQLLVVRGHSDRTSRENLWWTLLFAFGSVTFFSSVRGEVWFTALVMGVTLNLGFMLAALDLRHPWLAGLMLGLGMATRTPIAFCFVFFAWQLFLPNGRWEGGRWREIFGRGAAFAVPILVCGGLLIAYNLARFDLPFEFGHAYLSGGAGDRIRDHGLFSTWYLNKNLSAALINMPHFSSEAPYLKITKHGLGMFIAAPALLLLLRPKSVQPLTLALWATV
ncbi:MAG: glycosyltransferase 87 family protein, partial [Myxococcota bacterium]|nr:glycosyltransferase 87 family protein [Myxococcota bacterium]